MNDAGAGFYAKKQLSSASALIAWSHRRRYETALRHARRFAGQRVLDFGCGDGTFLAMLMADPSRPASAVGTDMARDAIEDCRKRYDGVPDLIFLPTDELMASMDTQAYDGVICMEVLEHAVDLAAVLDQLVALLAPGGRLLVSVPVETGLPLLVKQTVRRVAGWRGIGDYPGITPYTWRQLMSGVVAGGHWHIPRPVHRAADGSPFHDHKGFNWMALRRALADRLQVEAVYASPVSWLPPHLASQAWFVARRD